MQTFKCILTVMLGLGAVACGVEREATAERYDAQAAALTLPFPDAYFGMFMGRDAAAAPSPAESCGPLLEAVTTAWGALQTRPEFKQLADTGPWGTAEEARTAYAGGGCFTSGPTLDKPSAECKPDFDKLVAAWHAVERTPQFTVLISGAANHDLYASWINAVEAHCVLKS